MPDAPLLLAIDQGTTSTRAMIFDATGRLRGSRQQTLAQIFPRPGLVEHDPEAIWHAVLATCEGAMAAAGVGPRDIESVGITNQRETTILWHRVDGRPLHNAIVWQDRRTADDCAALVRSGAGPDIQARSGLVVDAYFPATKLAWLLDNVAGARIAAEKGELAFGTVDSFLLWRLTDGRVHATDATNASRSMLWNIHTRDWDDDLLRLFRIPRGVLPKVVDSSGFAGEVHAGHFGGPMRITGIAGDQQAALAGQACFDPGMAKCTFGTGAFALVNTGGAAHASTSRLLTTVALGAGDRTTYALEGSVFNAGAAVQWLRDGLGLIDDAAETEALAASVADTGGVHMVPAFTGLGAPWWDAGARGALLGLGRDTTKARIVRATLEAVCFQTLDLVEAMAADGERPATLRVDGGMAANDWFLARLADILGIPVERPRMIETTALGVAFLAGLGSGVFASTADIARGWSRDKAFEPGLDRDAREALRAGWRQAIARVRTDTGPD